MSGRKDDGGKPRMDLVDWETVEALAGVMGYGAVKYQPNNWRKGLAWSRFIAAGLRHLTTFARGEETDPESGHPHLAHAMANLMMLYWHSKHRKDLDDRYIDEPRAADRWFISPDGTELERLK